MIDKMNDIYWNIADPLSYNVPINIIIGERGNGKSFGAKLYAVNQYLKDGSQFAYVRRYREELAKSSETFFSDLQKEGFLQDKDCYYKAGKFYIDEEVAGYAFSLSTAKTMKSNSFPNIWLIIYDEFLIDPKDHLQRYLTTEVESLLNLYETIARLRTVKLFMLANALSFTNPYFIKWDLEKPDNVKGIRVFHDGFILVQVTKTLGYRERKAETPLGKFLMGTDYGNYMILNEALRDNDNLVGERPKDTKMLFILIVDAENYGVWYQNSGNIFVSKKHDPNHRIKITVDIYDHKNGTLYIKSASSNSLFQIFVKAFHQGNLYFDDFNIKNVVLKAIKRTL